MVKPEVAHLTGQDPETQAARLAYLNGKNLLFISGALNWPSIPAPTKNVLQTVRKHGLKVYCVMHLGNENNNYCQQMKNWELYDEAIWVDMSGAEAPKRIAEAATALGVKWDGVFATHDHQQALTGQVAEIMDLPGNPVSAYEAARDKFGTRMALERANLATPKAVQMWGEKEIPEAIEKVGFPMIIKPTSGAGSMGVYKVVDEADFRERMKQLVSEISGESDAGNNAWIYQYDAGLKAEAPIMAETYVVPVMFGGFVSEFDIECLFSDGECVYANVVDNWLPDPPYFQDKGFNCPTIVPPKVAQELKDYCIESVKAMGFKRGNFHMEAWYTTKGPMLIECNPRVGGGLINDIHQAVYDIDMTLNFLMTMMDIPVNPPRLEDPEKCRVFYLLGAPRTGILERVDFFEEAKKHPWVIDAPYFCHEGKNVNGIDTTVPEWLGHLSMETGIKNLNELIRLMQDMEPSLKAKAASATRSLY